jgi:hypothetical protein
MNLGKAVSRKARKERKGKSGSCFDPGLSPDWFSGISS